MAEDKKPAQSPSGNEAGKQNSELEELKKKSEEYLNGWKRERADFLNYKKDEMERIGQLVKYANEEIILKILPILDNIHLAEQHLAEARHLQENFSADAGLLQETWLQGFVQIKKQLEDFLAKEGIEKIKTVGEKFDPNTMEAVGEAEIGDKGIVAEEVQKGYTLHGKVIRPAKVKVNK